MFDAIDVLNLTFGKKLKTAVTSIVDFEISKSYFVHTDIGHTMAIGYGVPKFYFTWIYIFSINICIKFGTKNIGYTTVWMAQTHTFGIIRHGFCCHLELGFSPVSQLPIKIFVKFGKRMLHGPDISLFVKLLKLAPFSDVAYYNNYCPILLSGNNIDNCQHSV